MGEDIHMRGHCSIIKASAGSSFDPDIVKILEEVLEEPIAFGGPK
jgi:hypothetical protein